MRQRVAHAGVRVEVLDLGVQAGALGRLLLDRRCEVRNAALRVGDRLRIRNWHFIDSIELLGAVYCDCARWRIALYPSGSLSPRSRRRLVLVVGLAPAPASFPFTAALLFCSQINLAIINSWKINFNPRISWK